MAKFKFGDSVILKNGTYDPDYDIDLGGRQGRIEKVETNALDKIFYRIDWDSISLSQMSMKHILQCEEDWVDWEFTFVEEEEIELTQARDTEEDVDRKLEELKQQVLELT